MIDPLLKVLNDSGYPLQLAVNEFIDAHSAEHGWRVRYIEHHWEMFDRQRTGFADIVATNRAGIAFAVVECKRVKDTEWILFHVDGKQHMRRHAQAWYSEYTGSGFARYGWSHFQIEPTCPEVNFCAVRGQSTGSGATLLERIAAEVAIATECIAHEHKDIRPIDQVDRKFFFPVIVTTAKLRLATFDRGTTRLEDGTLNDASFDDVPFVRFRKQLGVASLDPATRGALSGHDISYRKESTVFVVHAPAINTFLAEFEATPSTMPFV